MNKHYVVDRVLHWISAICILLMMLNMKSQIHIINYEVKGQNAHRQEAIESHVLAGLFLLVILMLRVYWYRKYKTLIPRHHAPGRAHNMMIKMTHVLMYTLVAALAVTGAILVKNNHIPLFIFGMSVSDVLPVRDQFFDGVRELHLWSITALGWLIGMHVIGVMAARR
ncbi:cytochrome b/b6 domain-containing protein [Rheinheimera sp. 4Y26]|uniref:cytochrome b/b6 domain-containing protein n=1 Tax=Rheinheimera sp. 4Y26 TaxID=2977811 RepID=UPI0021B14FA7|nr:cytochrome b/b6 domain-containing protein [Rheinheimera sp. 4Y26]MCT6697968.1 cytochrome b/b6 domain-containing protein [Rheinheimera sp. 4Y26]